MNSAEKPSENQSKNSKEFPNEEVPIGKEEEPPDPEEDTAEITPEEKGKQKEFLMKEIENAKDLGGLCTMLKKEGYEYMVDGIYETSNELQDLISGRESKEGLKYTIDNVFESNEDLFKWLNFYDEEMNKALKDKVIKLLKEEVKNLLK